MIEGAVHDALGIRIDRGENAGENLKGQFAHTKLAPKATRAKILLCNFAEVFCGDAEGRGHVTTRVPATRPG